MSSSHRSRRTIFRQTSRRSHIEWPAYDSTPLYDRTSLAGLESDVRTVSEQWFRHDAHGSVDEFVRLVPLAYFRFGMYDCYTDLTSYEMQTLFRLFLLKECHGWDHETALVEYLSQHHNFCFAFACLLYSIWRAVDLLVQVELTGEYEHSPIVTADNTLTLLKKETGIG